MTAPVEYPAQWEADAVLSDGGTIHIRPITPGDADRLREFHSRWSPETVYNRFFSMMRTLPARDVERFTQVDHDERAALVAVLRDRIVGVVRYARLPGTHDAEVAVVVEDAHQGRGLGALLLEHMESAARERGVQRFVADVLPSNRRMLGVFRAAGFEIAREMADGYIELTFPITETAASRQVVRAREHSSEARSVARLLSPQAVAVIGASREPGTAGHEIFRSLLAHGFNGPAYPVNPAAPHVLSVRAYADVRDVPDDLDLAIVAVPAPLVADVVRACSQRQVRGVLVVSGGFGDAGEQGRQRLAEIVRLARDGGMRLIGPNAMGVVNTDPAVSMHATFAAGSPRHGRIGVFSHSGALAGTVLAEAVRRSLGISTFVSLGDWADVSGNDVLQYWQDDPATDVVLLHMQGFGNPRKFVRIAQALGRTKPVVALKSGRGAGDRAVDALFGSAGVLRVETLGQLFETGQLLALQPLPRGGRVAVIGTSSALAALASDACLANGLSVPLLSDGVCTALQALAGNAQASNPVDLGPQARPEVLAAALECLGASGEVDALLAVVTPQVDATALAAALVQACRAEDALPLVCSYLGMDGVPPELGATTGAGAPGRGSVPSFASPEAAALALARARSYATWLARPLGSVPQLTGLDLDAARAVVAGHPHDGAWLPPQASVEMLAAVGLSVWPMTWATHLQAALDAATAYGYPVALKSADERWRNRTDVGAARLGLVGPDELRAAWEGVQALVGSDAAGQPLPLIVQPMAAPGISTVVRVVSDPGVGPLISLRLGGVAADLLADPYIRTLPLTDVDAVDLVDGIRGAVLLQGADTEALRDLLIRVARLAEEVPELAELALDPVLVGRPGCVLLHAGVRLLPPGHDPERGPRSLGVGGASLFGRPTGAGP